MIYRPTKNSILGLAASLALLLVAAHAFSPVRQQQPYGRTSSALFGGATTMDPPTKERTFQDNEQQDNVDDYTDDDIRRRGPLEYLQDDLEESRELDDPFHILLLGSTFEKPKMTVPYVSSSLTYVLDMPPLEATELATFARDEGMSCLGTWTREECLTLGRQLQVRDVVCRVVPYCEGGQRGWQAKDASNNNGDFVRSDNGGGGSAY